MNPASLARRPVRDLTGIQWGTPLPKNFVRLQFSEAPAVFPPILRALRKEIESVNLYPDISTIDRVRGLIGKEYGVGPKGVYLGSGVDSLIDIVARTFISNGDEVLITAPTYPCYEDAVKFMGGTIITLGLEADFSLNLDKFLTLITSKTKLIFIPNPTNPTGNLLLTVDQIRNILESFSGILVIDEEYVDFSGISSAPLLKQYRNLVILRGYSKSFGIAGLRLGAAIADESIIRLFDNSQGATQVFEVNRLALAGAEAIYRNRAQSQRFIEAFKRSKDAYEQALSRIPGIDIRPTLTSFTIFSTPFPAAEFRERMLQRKIAMKSMAIYAGVPKNLILSAVPSKKNVKRVLLAVREVVTA